METKESIKTDALIKKEQPTKKPEIVWYVEYTSKLRKCMSRRSMKAFDTSITEFIKLLREEVVRSLNGRLRVRSFFMTKELVNCLYFYSELYNDVGEILDHTLYTVRMMEIMPLYLDLEILSFGTRVYKTADVAGRILTVFDTFLKEKESHACEVLLHITIRWELSKLDMARELLSTLFQKLLENCSLKPNTDVEYIQYLLMFRLWKLLERNNNDMCNDIMRRCFSKLQVPKDLRVNKHIVRMFPQSTPLTSIKKMLLIPLNDIFIIQNFLKYCVALRRRSLIGLDIMSCDMLSPMPVDNSFYMSIGEIRFQDFMNNVADDLDQSLETQDTMADLMSRLIASSANESCINSMRLHDANQRRDRQNNRQLPKPSTSARRLSQVDEVICIESDDDDEEEDNDRAMLEKTIEQLMDPKANKVIQKIITSYVASKTTDFLRDCRTNLMNSMMNKQKEMQMEPLCIDLDGDDDDDEPVTFSQVPSTSTTDEVEAATKNLSEMEVANKSSSDKNTAVKDVEMTEKPTVVEKDVEMVTTSTSEKVSEMEVVENETLPEKTGTPVEVQKEVVAESSKVVEDKVATETETSVKDPEISDKEKVEIESATVKEVVNSSEETVTESLIEDVSKITTDDTIEVENVETPMECDQDQSNSQTVLPEPIQNLESGVITVTTQAIVHAEMEVQKQVPEIPKEEPQPIDKVLPEATIADDIVEDKTQPVQESVASSEVLTIDTQLDQIKPTPVFSDITETVQNTPKLEPNNTLITTPELIDTCMSILAKDETSRTTALAMTTQTSRVSQSLLVPLSYEPVVSNLENTSCDDNDNSNREIIPTEIPQPELIIEEPIKESIPIENSDIYVSQPNASSDEKVEDENVSLPKILDCFSLNKSDSNIKDEESCIDLQEDVELNVSQSPKTYIDKGKDSSKRNWRENQKHLMSEKRNKILSPVKSPLAETSRAKVTFTETEPPVAHEATNLNRRRRNSFMTPAQLKYIEDESDSDDMEIDETISPPTEVLSDNADDHQRTDMYDPRQRDMVGTIKVIKAATDYSKMSSRYAREEYNISPVSPSPETSFLSPHSKRRISKLKNTSGESDNITSPNFEKFALEDKREVIRHFAETTRATKPVRKTRIELQNASPAPSSSSHQVFEVKNKQVPIANVMPQYKNVGFIGDYGSPVRLHKEEKDSDIQFRLNFYNPPDCNNKPASVPRVPCRFTPARRDINLNRSTINQHLQSTSSSTSNSPSPSHHNRVPQTGMINLSSMPIDNNTSTACTVDKYQLYSESDLIPNEQTPQMTPDSSAIPYTDPSEITSNLIPNQESVNATITYDTAVHEVPVHEPEPPPVVVRHEYTFHPPVETNNHHQTQPEIRPKWFSYSVDPPAFSPASPAPSDMDEQNLDLTNGEQTSLPFKKRRKLSVFQPSQEIKVEPPFVQGQDDEISYPSTPMMSIAEVKLLQSIQQLHDGRRGIFKTPGQLKFMPSTTTTTHHNNCQYTSNNQGNNTTNFQINSQVPVVNNISFNTNQNINNNFGPNGDGATGINHALSQFDINQTMINLSNYHLSQQHLTNFLLNSIHVPQNAAAQQSAHQQQQEGPIRNRKVPIRKCSDCKRVNCSCFAESDSDDGIVEAKKSQRKANCTPTDRVTRSSNRTVAKNYKEPDESKKRRKSGVSKRSKLEN